MRVSGFTIIRNGVKLQYPAVEAITSVLPLCDEFIVAVGKSEDGTLELIKSIASDKIRIIETVWDLSMGQEVLSHQTNIALSHCRGDWAFYVQTDEVIHEADLAKLKRCMEKYLNDPTVDALRFKWLHFYGSHWRYRIDKGWYQKQDRIIRNNKQVRSFGDAFGFERIDHKPLQSRYTGCLLYHYGWVFSEELMGKRRINQGEIWSVDRQKEKETGRYCYGDLERFPVYFGTHPAVMKELIARHEASRQDGAAIRRKFWWNPLLWFRVRYKTGRRIKHKIDER